MSDQTDTKTDENATPEEDQRVPYERFQQANTKAKEAADRATALGKELAEFKAQMEARDEASLPELERERKRAESLEKRIADAEKRAEAAEQSVQQTKREQWVSAAAAKEGFANPAVASRLLDDLNGIEGPEQAERAVKRLAKAERWVLKTEDTALPGKVLDNGRPAEQAPSPEDQRADQKAGLGAELHAAMFGNRQ